MGRLEYHKEDLERFLEFYDKYNCNISRAALAAGIKGGRDAVLRLADIVPWFKKRMEDVLAEKFDNIEEFVVRKGQTRATMAKFLLENHKEGRRRGYGKQTSIKGSVAVTWSEVAK
jgi:hypothetical protein